MNKRNLQLEVYNRLRASILNFEYFPGVKISAKSISQELGISRTPVKEALVRLSEQGLVETHHNKGVTVKSFTAKEIQDLYALRETLETWAVRQTIPNLNQEKIKTLRNHVDSFPSFAKSNNLTGLIGSDEQFHILIATYSENISLTKTFKNLIAQIRIARRYDHLFMANFQSIYEEHLQIIDYLFKRETSKAVKAMSRHVNRAKKNLLLFIQASRHEFHHKKHKEKVLSVL